MTRTLGLAAALAAVAAFAAPAPAARADIAYGVTLLDHQLITIDTTTGVGTLVAPLGTTGNPNGLAALGNQLYTYDSGTMSIDRINTSTGQVASMTTLSTGTLLGTQTLALQSTTVGYLTSSLDPSTFTTSNELYRINPTTGASTLIGVTSDTIGALTYGPNGTLYALGQLDGNLYTLNTSTAQLTLVGNVGVSVTGPTESLAFSSGGTLYATLNDALYTVNTSTGAATAVGSAGYTGFNSISGLAFATAVPEPSSVALAGLAALGFAAARLRRRAA